MSLLEVLANRPQDLLLPNEKLRDEALQSVKGAFDPIASQYSIFDQLHVDGLDAEQVWAQAQMVVDGVVDKLLTEEIPSLVGRKRKVVDAEFDSEDEYESEEDGAPVEEGESEDEFEDALEEQAEFAGEDIEEDESEEEGPNSENDDGDDEEVETANGLNDKFFNIDNFNQQILAMEQDEDDEDEDDENINYFGDLAGDDEDDKYKDFFDPAQKPKKKKVKKHAENFDGFGLEEDISDLEDAMESARQDMFDSEDEEQMDDIEPGENLSTFEKQQREIMKQIQELEEENVADKHWKMTGEVKKADRPTDSLVFDGDDIQFERSSRPAPVITVETTETLEEMIKRRILKDQFDDIPRRLPSSLPKMKSLRDVNVQETKSQKSLAELYEDDILSKSDPTYTSAQQEKLNDAHTEIVDLYSSIAYKLDALCSWNYTPRAPKSTITIRSNAAAITMEDAQPSTAGSTSMLAPQEIYQLGTDSKREVIGGNNMPIAKAEMSREERKRQRKRVKTKIAKKHEEKRDQLRAQAVAKQGGKADVVQTLKRGNVTVIGKHGEKRDVMGNVRKEQRPKKAADFRL